MDLLPGAARARFSSVVKAPVLTDTITQRDSRGVEELKTQAPLARSAAMPPGAARTWLCHRRLAGRALPGRDYIRGHCPPSREPVFAFDAVRFLAADVRLHICEKTVPWTCHRALPGVDLLPAARRTGAARRSVVVHVDVEAAPAKDRRGYALVIFEKLYELILAPKPKLIPYLADRQ